MLNNYQLVAYVEEVYRRGWVYWYGTYGNLCSVELYNRKKKQYPGHYGSSRTSGYAADVKAGKIAADCVGMIKSFFWTGGDIDASPKYGSNNCPDRSADGMYGMCKVKGGMDTMPDVPGIVLHRKGHIAVYVGDGYEIEERGYSYDTQKRKVTEGDWTGWGFLPENMLAYVEGDAPADPEPIVLGDRELRRGMVGDDVKQLQEYLIQLGIPLLGYGADGDFGRETERGVRNFQTAYELEVDGVYGAQSHKMMMSLIETGERPEDGGGAPDGGSEPARYVEIRGGDCWIRDQSNTAGKALGVAHAGDRLIYGGEAADNGWLKVGAMELGPECWVSGKYGYLTED